MTAKKKVKRGSAEAAELLVAAMEAPATAVSVGDGCGDCSPSWRELYEGAARERDEARARLENSEYERDQARRERDEAEEELTHLPEDCSVADVVAALGEARAALEAVGPLTHEQIIGVLRQMDAVRSALARVRAYADDGMPSRTDAEEVEALLRARESDASLLR